MDVECIILRKGLHVLHFDISGPVKSESIILIDFVQCIRTIKGKRIKMLSVIITVK